MTPKVGFAGGGSVRIRDAASRKRTKDGPAAPASAAQPALFQGVSRGHVEARFFPKVEWGSAGSRRRSDNPAIGLKV
jgi:hypothetical protein